MCPWTFSRPALCARRKKKNTPQGKSLLNSSIHCKHPVPFTVSFHNLCICFIEMTLNKTKYQFSWQCLDFLAGKAESSSTAVTEQLLMLESYPQQPPQQPRTNICLKAPIRKLKITLMTYPPHPTWHLSSWQSACLLLKKKKQTENIAAAVKN